jgi:hypothetical protein
VNAIFDGFKWHNLVDGDKNQFAAVYADCNESNCGLPFWLGKITKIDRHRNAEEDDPALKDAEEEPDTYEGQSKLLTTCTTRRPKRRVPVSRKARESTISTL